MVMLFGPLVNQSLPKLTGKATMLCERTSLTPGSTIKLGIRLEPAKGWHTYWVNPGDSGGPTTVKLHLPTGWKQGPTQYPTPTRMDLSGVVSYGYETAQLLIIPVQIPKSATAKSYSIGGKVTWLTCTSEVCHPADQAVSITLKADAPVQTAVGALFKETENGLPQSDPHLSPTVFFQPDGLRMSVKGLQKGSGDSDYYFFPVTTGMVDHSKPEQFSWKGSTLTAVLPNSPYAQSKPTRLTGVLAVSKKENGKLLRSYTINVPILP